MIEYRHNTLKYLLITTFIIAPIAEEIVFRLPLRYNKFYALFISRKKWDVIFKFLVYLFPIAFGLVHLSNFGSFNYKMLILFPLMVGSQLIGGFAYTYLRVKFNFLTTVIAHFIWNFIIMSIVLIESSFEKPYVAKANDYKIEIKHFEYNNSKDQHLKIDSLHGKIYRIEVHQLSINAIDSLFQYKRNKEDFIINLHFESKNGVSKKKFVDIMREYDKKEN